MLPTLLSALKLAKKRKQSNAQVGLKHKPLL